MISLLLHRKLNFKNFLKIFYNKYEYQSDLLINILSIAMFPNNW